MAIDDMELVREYATRRSEEAFAALVSRHVNLVYSVALRRLCDVHLAEESTQATFVILARKAGSLGPKTVLSAWLCRTAQYAAADTLRTLRRRQIREQEGYMQSLLNQPETEDPFWKDIAPLLDTAMNTLGEKDHCAIVLRFFEGNDLKQVGAALGVSANTAQTRVTRAVEKLRKFFSKRGVTLSATVIATAISAHSVHAAPATLAKTVTAAALSKGALAGGSTLTLGKALLLIMKTKNIVTAVTTIGIIIAAGTFLALRAKSHRRTASAAMVPIKLSNDGFGAGDMSQYAGRFALDTDPDIRRTAQSEPAGHIKSITQLDLSDAPRQYLMGSNGKPPVAASSGVQYNVTNGSPLLGQRIRVSGWMKSKDVSNWAGGILYVDDGNGHKFTFDDSTSRPVHGTTDWQPIEFVTDIPDHRCSIWFAPKLYGTGEIWYDDFQIDIVPPGTPITDDRDWRFLGINPTDYSETMDPGNPHDGHATLCVAYTPDGTAPKGALMWWGHSIMPPECDKYLGHTVRMTVWIKLEDVSGSVQTVFHSRSMKGVNAQQKVTGNQPNSGTVDWAQRTVTCRIPKESVYITTGFNFAGSGKFWIDMQSVKCEVVN